ncbi:hypothetical protein F5J12DRAFT_885604 [Pisolithus orientalis]|uniref:uncharacterized protein n=1 Tax=Pisolithus orientalis TaxID=936130 RepID=UPI0022240B06|nr:uncharacterized protein F5J12DRAFT_885604 [Pisolithus orientalis]KAI5980426.1 hypothetical protein F5J12DRAFT_885604 [Pisolithus orientalis]
MLRVLDLSDSSRDPQHRPSGADFGHESVSSRMKHGVVKFFSDMFGLESLKKYVGQITFFERLPLIVETQPCSKISAAACQVAPSSWNPFKSRAAQSASPEIVLLDKCKALDKLIESGRYLVPKQRARCEVQSISQTLSFGGETHSIQDTIYSRQVDVHSTPQEINALQMTLDATDDEDEQLTLEDITGKLLWLSWCEILSEVELQLLEVLNYIRRKRDSMMLEEHGHFYQCLNEIGKIIKKTPHVHVDDDLAHLQR